MNKPLEMVKDRDIEGNPRQDNVGEKRIYE